jgi:hypothetical protein
MAPARKALGVRSARDRRIRKGLPALAEMAPFFASEDAAVEYLLAQNVLTVPTCPTCGRDCIRKGASRLYRCQRDKYQASLVSLSISSDLNPLYLSILLDLTKSLSLTYLTVQKHLFFHVQIWG